MVVSGPPGSGKTTLAHALAGAIPCLAICRDEIKEGMAHADSLSCGRDQSKPKIGGRVTATAAAHSAKTGR